MEELFISVEAIATGFMVAAAKIMVVVATIAKFEIMVATVVRLASSSLHSCSNP